VSPELPGEVPPGLTEPVGGEWRLADKPWRLPRTYTPHALKRSA
jgi:hypothetical protein